MTIAAIVLAAGASTRFGDRDKLQAELSGKSVIALTLAAAEGSRCNEVVLVVSPDSATAREVAGHAGLKRIINHESASGMASSIRAGVETLGSSISGALIMLGDMPWIEARLIDSLIEVFEQSNETAIVMPMSTDGRRGHPVLFPKSVFPELRDLRGDVGARSIVEAHPELLRPVITETPAIFSDIDTAEDLSKPKR
jgi:molybdenum cofactor cytidylyltransferase